MRALVHELDPDLALGDVEPMRAKLAASVAQPRFYALLLALFAATALALAATGLYGVLSYSVARQTGRSAFAGRWGPAGGTSSRGSWAGASP